MDPLVPIRLNKFIAQATGMSRRAADQAIIERRIRVDGVHPEQGMQVLGTEVITLDGTPIQLRSTQTIMINKPTGYVVSRDGQGSKTVYDLLPEDLHHLKPVGRLDKNSSGLLLMTNDGNLADSLTHPRNQKMKRYEVKLDRALAPLHRQMVSDFGIQLEDGSSKLGLERLIDGDETRWAITMHEGRNRQIRRTFESLGYTVIKLHRTNFGTYVIGNLAAGTYISVS